jgi:hypothetical protein
MSSGYPDAQLARANRLKLAQEANERAMHEDTNRLTAVRANMARLRGLRLAKEEQEVRTEISTGNHPAKLSS